MAVTLYPTNLDVLEPEELLDWAMKNAHPSDDDSMVAAAEKLRALANNRQFILSSLRSELKLLADGRTCQQTIPQAYMHGTRSAHDRFFAIRSCLWTPAPTGSERSRELHDRQFSYVTPHDHSFALLTIGYEGPGYVTEIYEYDNEHVMGVEDEAVEIRHLETTQLSKGKVLYFRPRKDIHVQRHPEALSMSLNLIGEDANIRNIPQYEFDLVRGRIKSLLTETLVHNQMLPFQLVRLLGVDADVAGLLDDIALAHPSAHVRSMAYRVLIGAFEDDAERFAQRALLDAHPLVRHLARPVLVPDLALDFAATAP